MKARIELVLEPLTREDDVAMFEDSCEALVRHNVRWMLAQKERGLDVPCCAGCGGVRYVAPSAREYRQGYVQLLGAAELLRAGAGACGSIACYDVAACRVEGRDASVVITVQGPRMYHAVVRTPDGIHDPTANMQATTSCGCEAVA